MMVLNNFAKGTKDGCKIFAGELGISGKDFDNSKFSKDFDATHLALEKMVAAYDQVQGTEGHDKGCQAANAMFEKIKNLETPAQIKDVSDRELSSTSSFRRTTANPTRPEATRAPRSLSSAAPQRVASAPQRAASAPQRAAPAVQSAGSVRAPAEETRTAPAKAGILTRLQNKITSSKIWKSATENMESHRYVRDAIGGDIHDSYAMTTKQAKGRFKALGNTLNYGSNLLGFAAKITVGGVGEGLKSVATGCEMAANKLASKWKEDSGVSKKIVLGVGIAICKAVGSACQITGKVLEGAGSVAQELGSTLGSVVQIRPRAIADSLMRCVGAVTKLVTEPVKELGTQLKMIGNRINVPGLSQSIKLVGNALQGAAQITEGAVGFAIKAATSAVKFVTAIPKSLYSRNLDAFRESGREIVEGVKLLGAGIASAGKNMANSFTSSEQVKEDLRVKHNKYNYKNPNATFKGAESTVYATREMSKPDELTQFDLEGTDRISTGLRNFSKHVSKQLGESPHPASEI